MRPPCARAAVCASSTSSTCAPWSVSGTLRAWSAWSAAASWRTRPPASRRRATSTAGMITSSKKYYSTVNLDCRPNAVSRTEKMRYFVNIKVSGDFWGGGRILYVHSFTRIILIAVYYLHTFMTRSSLFRELGLLSNQWLIKQIVNTFPSGHLSNSKNHNNSPHNWERVEWKQKILAETYKGVGGGQGSGSFFLLFKEIVDVLIVFILQKIKINLVRFFSHNITYCYSW